MDRKGIIGIILPAIVLLVWWYYNNQEMTKLNAARAVQQAAQAEKAKVEAEAHKATTAAATPAAPAKTEPETPEQKEKLDTESVEYTFTTKGAGIAQALLKKHEAERGTRMTLNEFGNVPIGSVTELPGEISNVAFHSAVDRDAGVITFEGSDSHQLHLTKKFTVPKSTNLDKDYTVNMRLVFENRGAQPVTLPAYYVYTGSAAPVHQPDRVDYTGFKWPGAKMIDATWFAGGMFKKEQSTYTVAKSDMTLRKTSTWPITTPGKVSGKTMRQNTTSGGALSVIAASRRAGAMEFSMYTTGPAAIIV